MTTAARNHQTSNDISGVMDERERNHKVNRLNQLSNSFDRNAPSSIANGMNSEMSSKIEVS